jgi:hypothetical protein
LQHLGSRFSIANLQHTTIWAAITDELIGIIGVHQTLLIAFPQDLDSILISNLPAHAMLDTPSSHIPQEKARFQQVVTVIPGVSDPMWEAT